MEDIKKIVIVGASSGIGKEVARLFVARGYRVGVAARRVEALQELVEMAPERVVARRIDVTSEDAGGELISLVEALGGMDVYLNCAGIGMQNPGLEVEGEIRTAQTNVLGFVRMVDAAWGWFRENCGSGIGAEANCGGEANCGRGDNCGSEGARKMGRIAVISSIAGTKGLGAAPAYSATKRFQNTYIVALAQLSRMQGINIRFTDIRPGFVDTALLNDGRRYPVMMRPEKVAARIVRAIERGERVCTIDWRYRVLVFFWRLIPRWIWERLPIRN